MNYDFDTVTDRSGTASLKWELAKGDLPMWVADMDFMTAPEILSAIRERAEHGIFGYSIVPDEWAEAYCSWWKERHGLTIEKDWLVFCTGVIPALSSTVRKLTSPGENVLLQTPVYNTFFNSIVNNGRNILENPLLYDGQQYSIDWEDLEKKLSDPQTSLFILCNPHNPVGRIWDRDTLSRIGELCCANGVTVFADEIHCDLTDPGKMYVPFASVSETCRRISVTAAAPTKAFNLAGIQTAAVFASDRHLRHRIWRALNTDEVAEPNAFAVTAAVAAFTKGGPWLDALRDYLYQNKQYVSERLEKDLPQVHLVPSEATYLLWIDCRALPGNGSAFPAFLRKESALFVMDGIHYGKCGEGFVRMNIACPRSLLEEGMDRFVKGAREFIKTNE